MNQLTAYPETLYRKLAYPQMASLPKSCTEQEERMTKERMEHASSFMTPMSNMIPSRSSPPPLCKESTRDRKQGSMFESQDGTIYPQFLIPELNGLSSPQIKPFKLRFKQRLVHPFDEENISTDGVAAIPPIQLSKTFDESASSLSLSLNSTAALSTRVERPMKLERRSSSHALTA